MVVGNIPNLWPAEFGTSAGVTPKSVLNRQAHVITEKTEGRVEGEVSTRALGRDFAHTLYLVSPSLDNYRFFVVRVRHALNHMYPLTIALWEKDEAGREVAELDGLCVELQSVLQSEPVMEVVRSLVAQSQ